MLSPTKASFLPVDFVAEPMSSAMMSRIWLVAEAIVRIAKQIVDARGKDVRVERL